MHKKKIDSLPTRIALACRTEGKTMAQLVDELKSTRHAVNNALVRAREFGTVVKTGPMPSIYVAVPEAVEIFAPVTTTQHAIRHVPRSVFDLGTSA